MAGGEGYTLSLCVYSAELDSAANGAYCKVYVDANDRSNGSNAAGSDHNVASPDPSFATARSSDSPAHGARAFHTHVDKSEKKTYLPTWNETFTIDVYDRRHEILTIRLKSKKLLHVAVVGACAIPLHQIPTGRAIDQWFPVLKGGKRRGKLRLQMMITYPQATVSSVGTPQPRRSDIRSPMPMDHARGSPAPQQIFDHQRNGSQEFRRSGHSDPRGSYERSLQQQRPSSLSSQPSDHSFGQRQQQPMSTPTPVPQPAQPQVTLAATGYEPEDEPPKERSPLKVPSYGEIYRPATNPRVDLESDDDDEASFPRVAELHRLESDLIGEFSDDEADSAAVQGPKSPLYLERLTEGGASGGDENSTGRPSSTRGSATARGDVDEHLSLDDFKPKERASDSSATRSSLHSESPKPVASAEPPAAPTDRRTSVEIMRQTKVTVAKEDLAHMLEASGGAASSFESVDEDLDMSGVHGAIEIGVQQRQSSSSRGSMGIDDVAVGEVVEAEMGEEVWNRYSSSSSEDLELPYPDQGVVVSNSSATTYGVDDDELGVMDKSNPFVEPGSPGRSSHAESEEERQRERFNSATTPRGSISSDGENHHEFFGGEAVQSPKATIPRKSSSPRNSWVVESAGTPPASPGRKGSSPRNSRLSEGSTAAKTLALKSGSPRSSWISEASEPPAYTARRDKAWSGTSWVDESTASAQERSSWISEKSEISAGPVASPRRNGRDKSWSGTSWINEAENSSFVAASIAHHQSSSPRSSWISEKSETSAASPRRSGRDKSWSGTSWVDESHAEDHGHARAGRTSWISENDESPRRTGRDKSWSGTSWINENENSSFVDASPAPQTSSPRRSGRDKSWSGTSWISENENSSFVDASHPQSPPRSSWISESSDDMHHESDTFRVSTSPRSSWVAEDAATPPVHRTGRDKSWSGASWISEHEHTSFVDASGAKQDNLSFQHDEQTSPRNSWVSEDGAESPARLAGRDKSWSGTSWISENEHTSFVHATAQQQATPRTSWISEAETSLARPGADEYSRTSWVSESDAGPRLSVSPRSSWVSEATYETTVASGSRRPESPRHSWVSEADSMAGSNAAGQASRTSWVSESAASEALHHASATRTSWVGEETNATTTEQQSPSPRTSWVSEHSHSAESTLRHRLSSSQTSWVNEAPHSNSFVDASSSRHSFASESSAEENLQQVTVEAGVAIVSAPVRDSVDGTSPPRESFLSEISDIIEAQPDMSPRSSISSQPTTEPASQTDTIASTRMSSSSSEASEEMRTARHHQHDVVVTDRQSMSSEHELTHGGTPRGSLLSDGVEEDVGACEGTPRGSYLSNDESKHAHFETATSPRSSLSSEHLSMEGDSSSAPRLSFGSDARTTDTNVEAHLHVESHVVTERFSEDSDDITPAERAQVVAIIRESQSSSGRSSGYDADNVGSSTTRSSLFSEHARDHEMDAARRSVSSRSSHSSGRYPGDDGRSSFTESYTDLTRRSSMSSAGAGAGADNVVVRDDAGRHAEAVAEAARYSSSSEGEFEREQPVIHLDRVDDRTMSQRRYSSASEGDTVDRNSIAIGYSDYDDHSARSHSSSAAARDEARFAAWAEESSATDDLLDEMRRTSQVSSLSDMYDASPRTSDDLGVIPESHAHRSVSGQQPVETPPHTAEHLLRFVSSVNVFVEPYDDGSPRSSISNDAVISRSDGVEAVEVIDAVDVAETVVVPTPDENVRATVTVETLEPTPPRPVNPFIEYGSSRGSSSSEEELSGDHLEDDGVDVNRISSHSSEGDHEVIVVETLDQLDGPVDTQVVAAAVETNPSRSSSTSERLTISSQNAAFDTLLATREYVDCGEASPHSSLSSVSPRDHAYDSAIAAGDLLESAARQCNAEPAATSAYAPGAEPEAACMPSPVAVQVHAKPVYVPSPLSVSKTVQSQLPAAAVAAAVAMEEEESKSDPVPVPSSSTQAAVARQNVRGDHVLLSSVSTLTREQLQHAAVDYLPSDSESEGDYASDQDFNFDSDSD